MRTENIEPFIICPSLEEGSARKERTGYLRLRMQAIMKGYYERERER